MAENECLSLEKSPRWLKVYRAIGRGEPPSDIAEIVKGCLCKTIQAVLKHIPHEKLLASACQDADALGAVVRQCKRHREHAQLFVDIVEKGVGREALLKNYLSSVCERFFADIQQHSMGKADMPKPDELHRLLKQVRNCVEPFLHAAADSLAKDATKAPRLPSRRKPHSSKDPTIEQLNESLRGINPL